jgi:hypothetical protein
VVEVIKAQFILEVDSNANYFHSDTNGRHMKKVIHSLVQDEGMIDRHNQLRLL